VGPFVKTKAKAKALVALECISTLHFYGELDDWLLNANRAESIQKRANSVEFPVDDRESASDVFSRNDKGDSLEEEFRIVPSALSGASYGSRVDEYGYGEMYLYCATANASSQKEMNAMLNCPGMKLCFDI
jgi:hypothetical protein